MDQTCSRYECFVNNKNTGYFYSAFYGNNKKYSFRKDKLYLDDFDRNRKMPNFKFRSSVATNQSDEYHINRDLIDKPI